MAQDLNKFGRPPVLPGYVQVAAPDDTGMEIWRNRLHAEGLSTQATSVTLDLTAIDGRVTTLEGDVADHDTRIPALEGDVADHGIRITDLEANSGSGAVSSYLATDNAAVIAQLQAAMEGRTRFLGNWVLGTYERNDQVVHNQILYISRGTNSVEPGSGTGGPPIPVESVPDAIVWDTPDPTVGGISWHGQIYTFTTDGILAEIQTYSPTAPSGVAARVVVRDATTQNDGPVMAAYPFTVPAAGAWVRIPAFVPIAVTAGQKISVVLESYSQASSGLVALGEWTRDPDGPVPSNLLGGTFTFENGVRDLHLSDVNASSADYGPPPSGLGLFPALKAGDVLFFQSLYRTYSTARFTLTKAPVSNAGYTSFLDCVCEVGPGGPPWVDDLCTVSASVVTAGPDIEIAQASNYWATNTLAYATVESFAESGGAGAQVVSDHNFGIRIFFEDSAGPSGPAWTVQSDFLP